MAGGDDSPGAADLRPPVWVGHVVLETDRIGDSARFMRTLGMRVVHEGSEVAIFELRGGTHLILLARPTVTPGDAPFDLMVEDLHAAHRRFAALGLAPSAIEAVPRIDHELFRVTEPAGHRITFYSSHVSGPV
jgi:hypothetical protein